MKRLDKYRGCLIGVAAGDALGYTVEFSSYESILQQYGRHGITAYVRQNGVAEISDDTQMTLFTANGLLLGATQESLHNTGRPYSDYIGLCYRDWLRTQTEAYPLEAGAAFSWLVNVPGLFHSRAPGCTCLSALASGGCGTIQEPINQSKGCGGIMRVAPVGLYFDGADCGLIAEADRIGAEAAALTHGHELGYIPAAAFTHIICLAAHEDVSLLDAVLDMREFISSAFAGAKHLDDFISLTDKAVALSGTAEDDVAAIGRLGGGWVAEETLAIAVYCALKYEDDFDKALIAAVNHGGDSDSTGAVTGNILGAALGLEGIPAKYLDGLELKNVILTLADDLYNGRRMCGQAPGFDGVWTQKYVEMTYRPEEDDG